MPSPPMLPLNTHAAACLPPHTTEAVALSKRGIPSSPMPLHAIGTVACFRDGLPSLSSRPLASDAGCRPYGHTKMVLWPQSYGGQPRAGTPLTLFHLPADD